VVLGTKCFGATAPSANKSGLSRKHIVEAVVSAGKVRYIGVSNWRAWQVLKGLGIANEKGYTRIQSVQPRYNLLFRAIEEELVSACIEEGVGIISYNPLAGGMLTGRYQPGQDVQLGSRFSLIGISMPASSTGLVIGRKPHSM